MYNSQHQSVQYPLRLGRLSQVYNLATIHNTPTYKIYFRKVSGVIQIL